ncbi:MAG: nucleotide sugar dehydrogenase [Bryobacteraceae bacterium]
MSKHSETLAQKIKSHQAHVGVVGLGYVGLPLVVEFAEAGFTVTGIDLDQRKVDMINRGESYIQDIPTSVLKPLWEKGLVKATTDFAVVKDLDTISICVPTPLGKSKEPDMSFIVKSCESMTQHFGPGKLVVLESTTYPGTTDELMLPMFEKGGLKVGEDFFMCFSPERVDPGNAKFHTKNTPKVVGGITANCTELGALFYQQAIDTVVPVGSTRSAEMVKLLENTFRMINIGMVNEIARMCDRMNINVWEVIDAAATKPFGFMPFYPGPGLGGHCIPIDPFYLSWKSKQSGFEARFIELAGTINGDMPNFVVSKIQGALNDKSKAVKGSKIHIMGVAYKRDIDDVRESPALDVIHLLHELGADVTYSDPWIPKINHEPVVMSATDEAKGVKEADCVVIITDHKKFDYVALVRDSKIIVDTRNALKGIKSDNIVRL